MADNYLEKKMEDLRQRSVAPHSSVKSQLSNMLCYGFRKLRIVFLTGSFRNISTFILQFQKLQCRLALISNIRAEDTDLSQNHGCRFHHVTDKIQAESAWNAIAESWRDIDLIISFDTSLLDDITAAIAEHTAHLPFANDWGMPIIIVTESKIYRLNSIAQFSPYKYGSASVCNLSDSYCKEIAHILPFISLKSNACISTITIGNGKGK